MRKVWKSLGPWVRSLGEPGPRLMGSEQPSILCKQRQGHPHVGMLNRLRPKWLKEIPQAWGKSQRVFGCPLKINIATCLVPGWGL